MREQSNGSEHEHDGSGTRTTAVNEGFESERMKEKGSELGLLVKSKTVLFGRYCFFFFLTQNPVPAEISIPVEIGRNWSEQSKRAETPRNLARGGTGGFPVPVFMPARKIPSVPVGTKRN